MRDFTTMLMCHSDRREESLLALVMMGLRGYKMAVASGIPRRYAPRDDKNVCRDDKNVRRDDKNVCRDDMNEGRDDMNMSRVRRPVNF